MLTGSLASGLLIIQYPRIMTAVLLGVSVWSFCRFYYCAFYVIERYVDRQYRFSGLWSFIVYLVRKRDRHNAPGEER